MKKILIFMLVAVALAACLSACNGGGNGDATTTSINATTLNNVPTTKAPDNFDHAFTLRGLTYTPYEFSTPSSAAFVGLTTDDTLELFEYGYDGELVKEAAKTFYLSVEGYDAAQRDDIKKTMEANFASAEELEGVTITHEIVGSYYVMKLELKSLDDADILCKDINAGLLDYFTDERASLRIVDVENVMLSHDFIKR